MKRRNILATLTVMLLLLVILDACCTFRGSIESTLQPLLPSTQPFIRSSANPEPHTPQKTIRTDRVFHHMNAPARNTL